MNNISGTIIGESTKKIKTIIAKKKITAKKSMKSIFILPLYTLYLKRDIR